MDSSLHSGVGSGVVPDVFRILRLLLERIEDPKTGVLVPEFFGNCPPHLYSNAYKLMQVQGGAFFEPFPVIDGMKFNTDDAFQAHMNRTLRPTLTCIGVDNIPDTTTGGNVLRSEMTASFSLRLPPWIKAQDCINALEKYLTKDVPYGAKAELQVVSCLAGFMGPEYPPAQDANLNKAAREAFGADVLHTNEGGSIPFMGKLADRFPEAKFMVTGVLGPGSNAHCGNEMIYIPMLKKVMYTLTRFMELSAITGWK